MDFSWYVENVMDDTQINENMSFLEDLERNLEDNLFGDLQEDTGEFEHDGAQVDDYEFEAGDAPKLVLGKPVGSEQRRHFQHAVIIIALRQLRCCWLIEKECDVGMKLQRRSRNRRGDRAFNGFRDGRGFGFASSE